VAKGVRKGEMSKEALAERGYLSASDDRSETRTVTDGVNLQVPVYDKESTQPRTASNFHDYAEHPSSPPAALRPGVNTKTTLALTPGGIGPQPMRFGNAPHPLQGTNPSPPPADGGQMRHI